ncbi:hypothetical protein [Petrachloros mirabilis]
MISLYTLYRERHRQRLTASLLLAVIVFGSAFTSSANDGIVSIESITINPQANHRRAVILSGIARNVRNQNGTGQFRSETCGQVFDLYDTTGNIEVWYIIKCHTKDVPPAVAENTPIIVHATIDAPPTNVKDTSGKDLGPKAMATKLLHPVQ